MPKRQNFLSAFIPRNGDTPITAADEQRVRITLYDYEWAKLLDKSDKLKMIVDISKEVWS